MTLKSVFTKAGIIAITSGLFIFSSISNAERNLIPRQTINKSLLKKLYQYKEDSDVKLEKIVVKFKEGTGVRLRSGQLTRFSGAPALPSNLGFDSSALTSQLTNIMGSMQAIGLQLKPAFGTNEDLLTRLKEAGERRTGKQLANLNLYFEIPIPAWMSKTQINSFIDSMNALGTVELSYAIPKAEVASITPDYQDYDPTDPSKKYQGYLDPADEQGIDAKYAWSVPGGKGAGVKIVDVEGGWTVGHEDFPSFFYTAGTASTDPLWVNHGTAVLGVISGQENDYGVTGIAPEAQIGYSSYTQGSSTAITNAANAVGEGGIVLIELHREGPTVNSSCSCNSSQCNYIGVEYWQSDFDAIQTATANGVIVVEAAGNGSANLDDSAYEGKFDRTQRDSGAILVAGGMSGSRDAMCWTNYGSRIDVHGWGENVVTTGYGSLYSLETDPDNMNYWYTSSFSGTSSASPIIVGAAASLQGISLANNGSYLTPSEMRDLLTSTGTPQTGSLSKDIGPLPNLQAAADELLSPGEPPECQEYTDTIANHVTAGRAYSETAAGYWWFPGTTTYYAFGSDENLGTLSYVTVTLKEDPEAVFSQGTCPEQVDPVPPVIDTYDVEVVGTTVTITGTASDANNDITEIHLLYANEPGDFTCTGTTDFSCTITQEPGTYEFYLLAIDAEGNVSDPSETFSVTVEEESNETCVMATNYDHIQAGRAYECIILFNSHACANGSDEDLGYTGNAYWRPTSSIIESSPGVWNMVSSCP